MAKLLFDQIGEKFFENGVRNVALFGFDKTAKNYKTGVAWNGVTAFNVNPEGAEANPLYADDIEYLNLVSKEKVKAGIECYTYPDEFEECLGFAEPIPGMKLAQQARAPFGVVARTNIGNDVDQELGFKLHILYNALAAPFAFAFPIALGSPFDPAAFAALSPAAAR